MSCSTTRSSPERVRVIHRGVDLARFDPERVSAQRVVTLAGKWRLPDGVPVVMLPGRLTRWKGQGLLIEALARIRDLDWVAALVGSDQGRTAYRDELEAQIEALGLSGRVFIVDHCDDMPAAYMLADLVVSASTDPEGFGRVVSEAQALGRPVAVSDHGGAPEQVLPEETGFLFRPGDAEDLAVAIERALAADARGAAVPGRACAIANVRDFFSKDQMCAQTLAALSGGSQSAGAGLRLDRLTGVGIIPKLRRVFMMVEGLEVGSHGCDHPCPTAACARSMARDRLAGRQRSVRGWPRMPWRRQGRRRGLEGSGSVRRSRRDAAVEIVTRGHPDALELLRHDCAHVMAEAVQELYPGTQVTFGPAIENGFYYDFARDEPFTPDDLERHRGAHARDRRARRADQREVWDRARRSRSSRTWARSTRPSTSRRCPRTMRVISIYRQGDWLDLCVGPHLPSTGKLGRAFKLMKVSGAYWRGDAERAAAADLRHLLGDREAAQGLPAHAGGGREARPPAARPRDGPVPPAGRGGRQRLLAPQGLDPVAHGRAYMRRRLEDGGYVEVKTPQLIDRALWEASGHWEKFREHMFIAESEDRVLAVKPMNCPGHVQIFKQGITSYRDLPLRMAEFGSCHRNEPSGACTA